MNAPGTFTIHARDGAARTGRLWTAHGPMDTPAFMPVGTHGAVKGVPADALETTGAQTILANALHLAIRPGAEAVGALGGVHRLMGWRGPILTDSGGFQVYSIEGLRELDDSGVTFRSPIDGQTIRLTPIGSLRNQEHIGSDIAMCLDDVPAAGATRERVIEALTRTTRWATEQRTAQQRDGQLLFGIVQGGLDAELRARSARELIPLDFPGYAIGSLSVGESREEMRRTLAVTAPLLPDAKPRYLMGVGTPGDLVASVAQGVDMFDCVMPSRNGRTGMFFTWDGAHVVKNAKYRDAAAPIDAACPCVACQRYTLAALHHFIRRNDMTGGVLLTIHNLTFYQRLMARMRHEIAAATFAAWSVGFLAGFAERGSAEV
jgi:queuine tRNA-ribosyltransferase